MFYSNTGLDLVFVLDTSGSIGQNSFNIVRMFVQNVSTSLTVGSTRSQVAVILFSSSSYVYFNLTIHDTKTSLVQAINGLPYDDGGSTETASALQLLERSYLDGSLGIRRGYKHVAVVITDGQSSDRSATIHAANSLHSNTDFIIYAVGVGGAQNSELSTIATNPNNVFSTVSFTDELFQQFSSEVIQQLDSILSHGRFPQINIVLSTLFLLH